MKTKIIAILIITIGIMSSLTFCFANEKENMWENIQKEETNELKTKNAEASNIAKIGGISNIGNIVLTNYANYDEAYKVLDLVNQERRNAGLNELKMDESLLETAMYRAVETVVYWDHTRPNGQDCFSANSKMSGENIACACPDAQTVMDVWMASPGHRGNILDESFKSIGIGCVMHGGVYYWVQCFGTSEAVVPQTKKANQNRTDTVQASSDILTLSFDFVSTTLEKGGSITPVIYNINNGWDMVAAVFDASSAKWQSSNENVVKVNEKGTAYAVGYGSATVAGIIGTKIGRYTVYVNLPFKDVSRDTWYYNSVEYCTNNGIIYGTSDTTFSPNNKLTRGNLVTLLWRMEGSPKISGEQKFSDVKQDAYYYEAIKWAEKNKVVNGYDDGKFRPNNNITREQLATILKNYADYNKKDTSKRADLNKFIDNKGISSYAKDGVSWAVATKVMSGKENGTRVDPSGNASRAEAAAMIANYCNYIGK